MRPEVSARAAEWVTFATARNAAADALNGQSGSLERTVEAGNDSVTSVAPVGLPDHPRHVKSAVVLLGALMLSACGSTAAPAQVEDSDAAVPTGLESGCPPPDTPLRYPGGDLPVGAVGVRLCPGALTTAADGTTFGAVIQAPADELTTGVDALAGVVNDLSVFDPDTACFADDGPQHVYWFRYPDGDGRAVAYAEAGCHVLTVGKKREYREGERVAAAFADALAAKRADSMPSAATRAEGPGCSMPPMSLPISTLPHVPLAMTAATWCEGVGPYRMRATLIPAPHLQRINEALLGDPTDQRDDCEPSAYGRAIEGITAWGDRVYYGDRVARSTPAPGTAATSPTASTKQTAAFSPPSSPSRPGRCDVGNARDSVRPGARSVQRV